MQRLLLFVVIWLLSLATVMGQPAQLTWQTAPAAALVDTALTPTPVVQVQTAGGAPFLTPTQVTIRSIPAAQRLSVNGRHFVDPQGRPVLLTGSHTWNNLPDIVGFPYTFDWTAYMERFVTAWNAGTQGAYQPRHNAVRLWAQEYFEFHVYVPNPFQKTGPGMDAAGIPNTWDFNAASVCQGITPGVTPIKFDQAYFDRAQARVEAARDAGVYVIVVLFNGWSTYNHQAYPADAWDYHWFNPANNCNGIDASGGTPNGVQIHTNTHADVLYIQQEYVKKMIDTLHAYDNVLWEIANESHVDSLPWQDDFVQFIKAYEAANYPTQPHLVGISSLADTDDTSWASLYASSADWVSVPEVSDTPPVHDSSKPNIFDTDHSTANESAYDFRGINLWKTFMRGNSGVIYMDGHESGTPIYISTTEDTTRRAMGGIWYMAQRVDLLGMSPQDGGGSPSDTGYALSKTSAPAQYIVFQPDGADTSIVVSGIPTGTYTVTWFNMDTGAFTAVANRTYPGASTTFTTPNATSRGWGLLVRQTTSPAELVLVGTTAVNSSGTTGNASFPNLTLPRTGQAHLFATAATVTSDTSASFAITTEGGTATSLAYTQIPSSTDVDVPLSPSVVVQVRDQTGAAHAQAGLPITLTKASGPGTLSGGGPVNTNGSGVASFGNVQLSAAGTVTITASSPGLTSVTSGAISITEPSSFPGVTYYVAPNGSDGRSCGTAQNPSTPRQTVNGGISCLNSGERVVLKPGTYVEDIGPGSIPDGSDGSPTIIQGETPGTAILRSAGGDILVHFNPGQSYITLKDFVLDGNFDSVWLTYSEKDVGGVHFLRFENMIARNSHEQGYWGEYYNTTWLGGEVYNNGYSGTGDTWSFNNVVCELEYCGGGPCPGYCHGFYVYGGGLVIDGVYIHHNDAGAIQMYYQDVTVRNCTITHSMFGVGVFGSGDTPAHIYNNTFWKNQWGVWVGRGENIAHNTFWGSQSWAINDIVNPGGNQGENIAILVTGGSPQFRNNLILQQSGSYFQIQGGSPSISGNVCDDGNPGAPCIIVNPSPSPVLDGDSGDLRLSEGSSAIERSSSLGSQYAQDKAGNNRPTSGSVDAGAYVFAEDLPPPGPSIAASPSSVQAGNAVTAEWFDIAAPTANDTVRLYATAGAPDTSSLAQISTSNTANGSAPLTVPVNATPGTTYQLRLFSGSGVGNKLATSNSFTVTAPPGPDQTEFYMATTGDDVLNNCTIGAPCATLEGIIPRMSSGDTLWIRAGTYPERYDTSGQPPIPAGIDWNTPTWIRAYPGEPVTLAPTGPGPVLALSGGSNAYLILDRLTLSAQTAADTNGLWISNGAHHIRFQDGEIRNAKYENIGILGNDVQILRTLIHGNSTLYAVHVDNSSSNLLFEGNTINGSPDAGIHFSDTGTFANAQILRTIVRNTGGHGIVLGAGTAHVINTLVHGHTGTGIVVGAGSSSSRLLQNTIMDGVGPGISISGAAAPFAAAANTLLINNIVFNNTGGTIVNNGTGTTGTPNLTTNPGIVGGGNYQLASDASTAHETGTPLDGLAGRPLVSIDLGGKMRPQGSAWDIGAYERIPTGIGEQPPSHSSAGMLMGQPR